MSLRAEIREAIDEVAPPAPGLVYEVLDSVFERARPKARRRLSLRFRAPLALVAALVALALIVGLVVGGRILRDIQIPAGHNHGQTEFQRQVAELEARPVRLPALVSGDPCPDTGVVLTSGTQYGNGPVWMFLGSTTSTTWGKYVVVTFRYVVKQNPAFAGDPTLPALTGPVVVRGRDLKFSWELGFVGAGATGAVVGNEPAHAPPDLRAQLVIDTSHPWRVEDNSKKLGHIPNYGLTTAQLGIRAGSSGCFGLQIDTLGGPPTQTITVAG
jgi:hypothetical protein